MKTIFAAFILLTATFATAQDQPAIKVTTCHSGDWITPASEGEGYNMAQRPVRCDNRQLFALGTFC